MCYGTCKYEGYHGECRFTNRFPADATCMIEDCECDEEEEYYEEMEGEDAWKLPQVLWT